MVISLFTIVVSFIVFFSVRQLVYGFNPTNPVFAELLVLIIATAVVSLIFTWRQFRLSNIPRLKNPLFHKRLLTTFIINFLLLFMLTRLLQ